jgi:hypothetical protein
MRERRIIIQMRTVARAAGLAIVLAMTISLATATAFAVGGTLTIDKSKTSPKDGSTSVPIENVGIKLYFNEDVTAAAVWENNAACFTLADSEGKPVPTTIVQGGEERNYILVVAEPPSASKGVPGQLAQKSDYTLTISGELTSASGNSLGEEETIGFTTMDMSANSRLSMLLMVGMMVGIIVLMVLTNTRKMKAEAEAAALLRANPYRIAKEKGIPVDEAKALIEKAKEKNREKLEKTGGKAPAPEEKTSAVPRLGAQKPKKETHRVKAPRPVSEGGSAYKTNRKAEAEKKAKAEAAKKAARARQQGGGSNSGRSSKGKKK